MKPVTFSVEKKGDIDFSGLVNAYFDKFIAKRAYIGIGYDLQEVRGSKNRPGSKVKKLRMRDATGGERKLMR